MDGLSLDGKSLNLPIESANHLKERYERLVNSLSSHYSGDTCDEAKAFLECIFRTIVTDRNGQVDEGSGRATFISLFDQAWDVIIQNELGDTFRQHFRKTAQLIGDIRNNYGGNSHGQDGYDDRSIAQEEAVYLARQALAIAGYMYAKHLRSGQDNQNVRIHYEDNPAFNEYLDSSEEVTIAGIAMVPSEVLFQNDPIAYKEQLIEFKTDSEYESWVDAQSDAWMEMQGDIERGK